MTDDAVLVGLPLFVRNIKARTGIDMASYSENQVRRRLAGMVRRAGVGDLSAYWAVLRADEAKLQDFVDRFTINVSEFFRDAKLFAQLREYLEEMRRTGRVQRLWSAGCSVGAEPYTLSIMTLEMRTGPGTVIEATDLDEGALAKARRGVYHRDQLRQVEPGLLSKYFTPAGEELHQVGPQVQERVRFRQLDLLRGPYPTDCDVALCRNVVIYFTQEAKAQVFAAIARSLRPGGLLFIGATERVPNPEAIGLQSVVPFFYRKPGPDVEPPGRHSWGPNRERKVQ